MYANVPEASPAMSRILPTQQLVRRVYEATAVMMSETIFSFGWMFFRACWPGDRYANGLNVKSSLETELLHPSHAPLTIRLRWLVRDWLPSYPTYPTSTFPSSFCASPVPRTSAQLVSILPLVLDTGKEKIMPRNLIHIVFALWCNRFFLSPISSRAPVNQSDFF